ncbi:MAG TPA: adenosylcobinamide amidohydrolase [Acidimicrobiales bacterium]|nr:adenosylcobinamide amidohydrolase [Acidimicrobiales bacterium]
MLSHGPDGAAVLVWRFAEPLRCVSSAPLGGGLGVRHWVLNAQVPSDYGRLDPETHLEDLARTAGLEGPGIGLLTAVDVRRWHSTDDEGVRVDATVGVTHPTWAASDDPPGVDNEPSGTVGGNAAGGRIGTINVVAVVPASLSDGALVNAVSTVAEAKAQALWDAGMAATGTASDATCVASAGGGPVVAFGGPRSTWGARLARAVHRAVLAGCTGELG